MVDVPSPQRPSTREPADAAGRSFHHGRLRQALVDAALAAPEIENLSLRQLAAGVGVTAAAAYRHFGSREDLLCEVARVGFDRLAARFADAFDITRPPADAAEAQSRMQRLAQAYLQFADEEPALWRLMFGAQAAGYRAATAAPGRDSSYDHLPAALLGLHRTGVTARPPDERDAFFAWSTIHGAASLRSGRVPAALSPLPELASELASRVIAALRTPIRQDELPSLAPAGHPR
jgi:AcrR family transcriptional regulator